MDVTVQKEKKHTAKCTCVVFIIRCIKIGTLLQKLFHPIVYIRESDLSSPLNVMLCNPLTSDS